MPPQGVLFLQLRRFGLKTGIDFARLWSRTGYGFRGTSVEHFQMDKKEREMCEFEMDFTKSLLFAC